MHAFTDDSAVSDDHVAIGHWTHLSLETACVVFEYVPATQELHCVNDDAPATDDHVPAIHPTHV